MRTQCEATKTTTTKKKTRLIDIPAYPTLQLKCPLISSANYAYCIYPATTFMFILFEFNLYDEKKKPQ